MVECMQKYFIHWEIPLKRIKRTKLSIRHKYMENKEKDKNTTNFIKYSGMGFQMLATIGIFAFAGYKIDGYRNSAKPIYTAILGVIGVLVSLYQVVRQLNSKK
jgi:ATP synthase protein I